MTDLEMTKACAEAMGWRADWSRPDFDTVKAIPVEQFPGAPHYQYMPLRSDSDAMALVKRCNVHIEAPEPPVILQWGAYCWITNDRADNAYGKSTDLNRAIVECVAKKMREVKAQR